MHCKFALIIIELIGDKWESAERKYSNVVVEGFRPTLPGRNFPCALLVAVGSSTCPKTGSMQSLGEEEVGWSVSVGFGQTTSAESAI